MSDLVTVVVAFLNEERFLTEAVESVYAQTYPHWELVLVDDGSTDGSPDIAKEFASRDPGRVRYLEHRNHANRGASATRNLGVHEANGQWIGFLDGDDVWLPERLERGVALAIANPRADMVYGKTEYWHSWRGETEAGPDVVQSHFFRADRLVAAPELLTRHLALRAAVPCMGSLLIRRKAYLDSGGFDDSIRGLVDDAVFLAKFCLRHDVYVSNECWDRYRQHSESDTAVASAEGRMREAHGRYLRWLENHLNDQGVENRPLWRALRGAIRRNESSPDAWGARVARAYRRVERRLRGF